MTIEFCYGPKKGEAWCIHGRAVGHVISDEERQRAEEKSKAK